MIWPPVKAWTSKVCISGQVHFVAINYGGEMLNRWVIMMSVLDSNVVVKVFWPELAGLSNWKAGWDEREYIESSELVKKNDVKMTESSYPSMDSGLTIPISKDTIRPWFNNT